MRLVAPVPLTGRYAVQGKQMAAGLKLWAHRSGASLSLEDDESRPEKAVAICAESASEIVLGPYGSDSVRAVARAFPDQAIWNHGAAADDVQQLPNVISFPSPSSRYLVALASGVAGIRPGARVTIVTAPGRFAEHAWTGFIAEADDIDVTIGGRFSFDSPSALTGFESPSRLAGEGRGGAVDAVLAIGPVDKEIALFRQLLASRRDLLLGGVSPGLSAFPQALGADPEGFLAPVQWHPEIGHTPAVGPTSSQVIEDAVALGLPALDYVAVQAYAATLIGSYCFERDPTDPARVARALRTSTLFGDFELDPDSGEQRGHRMGVIQWREGRQHLL